MPWDTWRKAGKRTEAWSVPGAQIGKGLIASAARAGWENKHGAAGDRRQQGADGSMQCVGGYVLVSASVAGLGSTHFHSNQFNM